MVKITLQSTVPQVGTSHQGVIVNLSVLLHKLSGKMETQLSCDYIHAIRVQHCLGQEYLLSAIFALMFSRVLSCSSWVVLRKSAFSISICAFINWSFKF